MVFGVTVTSRSRCRARQMPVIQMAGQAAARRTVNGGYIWAGGSQGDFAAEAIGRAGGLMGVKPLDLSQVFRKDVVLYGAARRAERFRSGQHRALQSRPVHYVIAFAAAVRIAAHAAGAGSADRQRAVHRARQPGTAFVRSTPSPTSSISGSSPASTSPPARVSGKRRCFIAAMAWTAGASATGNTKARCSTTTSASRPIRPGVLGNAYLDRITQDSLARSNTTTWTTHAGRPMDRRLDRRQHRRTIHRASLSRTFPRSARRATDPHDRRPTGSDAQAASC